MTRRDHIARAKARIDEAVAEAAAELEHEGADGEEARAIARFALYRVMHERLVAEGYTTTIRWQREPFPEETDEESKP